ncbi:MAG: NAD(P)H-binding protein [Actinomycetota bacterium]|nr:NAD(P)H-binding protein [Actinomycetota bacterium]
MAGELAVVTGAFSHTGRYITERLLANGVAVRTLTRKTGEGHPLAGRVDVVPYAFGDLDALADSLRGARIFYNTYWIRFPTATATFEDAVARTKELYAAAREAGVARIVQLGVTNASERSPFPYFRAKAAVERELRSTGISHAIVRPTLVAGQEDILLNNVAWLLRRFPLFVIPGDGRYRIQPVLAEDVAEIAVAAGSRSDDLTLDAAGPETYEFEELVRMIAAAVGSNARIVRAPAALAFALGRATGVALRDTVLTREELDALMASALTSDEPPNGRRSLRTWLEENAGELGGRYARPR